MLKLDVMLLMVVIGERKMMVERVDSRVNVLETEKGKQPIGSDD